MKETFTKQELADFCNNTIRFFYEIWDEFPAENLQRLLELSGIETLVFLNDIELKSKDPPEYIAIKEGLKLKGFDRLTINRQNLIHLGSIVKVLIFAYGEKDRTKLKFYNIQLFSYFENILMLDRSSVKYLMDIFMENAIEKLN